MKKDFNIWDGIYTSFKDAAPSATGLGFNGVHYLERSLNAAQECLQAIKMSKPIPSFYKQRSTLLPPLVAMMFENKNKLRILDFGGGLGIGYMTIVESINNKKLQHVNYHIVEVKEVCEMGRLLFKGKAVTYSSELPSNDKFDLIHSASALQYIEDWPQVLKILCGYGSKYILLSDVFAGSIPSFVSLQNYYDSRICHWFLNLEELNTKILSFGYKIIMRSSVSSKRNGVEDILPMQNFPESHQLEQSLHLMLSRI